MVMPYFAKKKCEWGVVRPSPPFPTPMANKVGLQLFAVIIINI